MTFALPERFWHERGREPRIDGHGFLVDPLDHPYANPDVTRIDVDSLPACVAFLGDPGIGKTHTIDEGRKAAVASRGDDRVVYLDLGTVGNEYAFDRALLDDRRVVRWRGDGSELELYLDGLDESLVQSGTIAAHIARVLDGLPVERLRLRIGCRASEWPRDLDEVIRRRWPEAVVREIAPLREADVSRAAAQAGVDAEAFLRAVRPAAGPLAARPVTLLLFLRLAREKGALPGSREELYRQGLRLLCGEVSDRRQRRKQTAPFTEDEVFACAARIAAAMVFGNRAAIVESVAAAASEPESLSWSDVAPAVERVRGEELAITADLVRATVSRGLFRPAGDGRARWAHRTFAEFMAAEYLRTHAFTLQQKLDLLTGSGGGIVPQLRETAAWLADMDPAVRRALVRQDPLAVLRSEMTAFPDDDRSALVDSLFAHHAESPLLLRELHVDFRKLQHGSLGEQLAVQLQNGDDARRLVVAIAKATGAESMTGRFVDLVLDRDASFPLRHSALELLRELPRTAELARLATLLPEDIGVDYHEDLRGQLLDLLFPGYIEPRTLFASVVPQPEGDSLLLWGPYCRFVREKIGAHLDAAVAAAGLEWLRGRPDSYDDGHLLRDLVVTLLRFAYDRVTEEPFATLLPAAFAAEVRRSRGSVGPFVWYVRNRTDREDARDAFVAAVAAQLGPDESRRWLEALQRESGQDSGGIPAEEEPSPEPEPSRPDPWAMLADRLADPEREWWAKAVVTVWQESQDFRDGLVSRILRRFGGERIPELRAAAALYVRTAPRADVELIARRRAVVPVVALAAALELLGEEQIDAATLEEWLPALIVAPDYGPAPDVSARFAPFGGTPRVTAFLLQLFDRELELQRHEHEPSLTSLMAVKRHWNGELAFGLAERLRGDLPPPIYGALLALLLEKGSAGARADAEARIAAAVDSGTADEHALEAATRLVEETKDAGWAAVWPFLEKFPEAEERVLRRMLVGANAYSLAPRLAPSAVRDLATLMIERHGSEAPMANSLVGHLMSTGRVDEVRALRERYPALIAGEAVTAALEERARREWQPPQPEAIFRAATDARRRIVRDGPHLVEIVLTALADVQQNLHGDNPLGKFLWDADRPKGENDIRDWILDRLGLEREGVPSLVANKEVEVRKYYSDLKIEARPLAKDTGPTISVTIEVKACWHKELETAMETQLLGKYLRGSESPYGIYLVLWFGGELWTGEDGRKTKCAAWTMPAAEKFFGEQAERLSTDGVSIRAFVLDCSRTAGSPDTAASVPKKKSRKRAPRAPKS